MRDPTRPFFLQIGFQRPHAPYDAPVSFFEMYKEQELPEVPIGNWASSETTFEKVDSKKGKLSKNILDRVRRAYFAQLSHIDLQVGVLGNCVWERILL